MARTSCNFSIGRLIFGAGLLLTICTSHVYAQTDEISPRITKRSQHLSIGSHHAISLNAGYMGTGIIYFKKSDSGSLTGGLNIGIDYSWFSSRGFGAGIHYSANFTSAELNGLVRTAQIYYIAPEAVFRQRLGKRWLFRESAGIGYGRYIRRYGEVSGSIGSIGIHETFHVEYMLTKFLGISVGFGGQWIINRTPDVGDGVVLPLLGIFSIHYDGGLRFYF